MVKRTDWLPGRRDQQLAMAKNWLEILQKTSGGTGPGSSMTQAERWNIPMEIVFDFMRAITDAEAAFAEVEKPHTTIETAKCKLAFEAMIAIMRDIKDRYFKKPPLADPDFAALELKPKDSIKTSVPRPTAAARTKVSLTVKGQLKVSCEVLEPHGDSRSNYGVRLHYGVVASDPKAQSAKTGMHYYLPERTDNPEELKQDVFFKGDTLIDFHPLDSSHECIFCARIENQKGEPGPWGEIVTAIIP